MELLGNNPSIQDLIEKLNEVIGSLNNSLPNTDSEIAEVKKLVSFGSNVLAGRLNAKLWYFKTQELMKASTELCEGDSCFILNPGSNTGEGTFEYWYIYKTADVGEILDSYIELANPDLVGVKIQELTFKALLSKLDSIKKFSFLDLVTTATETNPGKALDAIVGKLLADRIGNLGELSTVDKNSLVGAIKEVKTVVEDNYSENTKKIDSKAERTELQTETSERKQEIAVERARINNLLKSTSDTVTSTCEVSYEYGGNASAEVSSDGINVQIKLTNFQFLKTWESSDGTEATASPEKILDLPNHSFAPFEERTVVHIDGTLSYYIENDSLYVTSSTATISIFGDVTISYTIIDSLQSEVADIRVGANGKVYDTAGEAVRGQVSELKGDIIKKLDALYKQGEELQYTESSTGLINHNNGNIELTDWYYHKKSVVIPNTFLIVLGITLNNNNDYSAVTFLNSENNVIGYYPQESIFGDEPLNELIKVPNDCTSIVVNGSNSNDCGIYNVVFETYNESIERLSIYKCDIIQDNGLYDPEHMDQIITWDGYGKVKVEVNEGEVYYVTAMSVVKNQFPAYGFITEDESFISESELEKDTVLNHERVVVPPTAKYMILNTKTSTLNNIEVFKYNVDSVFYHLENINEVETKVLEVETKVSEVETKVENSYFNDFVQMADLTKRVRDGSKSFNYQGFDGGYMTIIFDDGRHDLSTVSSICNEFNIPLCCAIPTNALNSICDDGRKVIDVCHSIVDNGGEILSHSVDGKVLTEELATDISFIKNMLMKSKEHLTKHGFIIRGFIRPGGTGAIDWRNRNLQRFTQMFYDYSDLCGDTKQYYNSRTGLGYTSIETAKTYVDDAIQNHKWYTFMSHTLDGTESQLTEEWFREFLTYATQQGIKFKTYSYMYDNFGKWI